MTRTPINVDALPPDIFWPRRVCVATDGDCVPFALMLAWHYQWFAASKVVS